MAKATFAEWFIRKVIITRDGAQVKCFFDNFSSFLFVQSASPLIIVVFFALISPRRNFPYQV